MSRLILLPGNGKHNRAWTESIRDQLGGTIQYYRHWETGEPEIDFEYEAQALAKFADGKPIRVLAKSAGCFVAIKAARELGAQIQRAVFVGTALNWCQERGLPARDWLSNWSIPTLFVHKDQDPITPIEDLRPSLPELAHVIELVGTTHDYDQFDLYLPQAKIFLSL